MNVSIIWVFLLVSVEFDIDTRAGMPFKNNKKRKRFFLPFEHQYIQPNQHESIDNEMALNVSSETPFLSNENQFAGQSFNYVINNIIRYLEKWTH